MMPLVSVTAPTVLLAPTLKAPPLIFTAPLAGKVLGVLSASVPLEMVVPPLNVLGLELASATVPEPEEGLTLNACAPVMGELMVNVVVESSTLMFWSAPSTKPPALMVLAEPAPELTVMGPSSVRVLAPPMVTLFAAIKFRLAMVKFAPSAVLKLLAPLAAKYTAEGADGTVPSLMSEDWSVSQL